MNQDNAKEELSIMLEDTLQQISADRLTAAISSAWRDGYVAAPIHDETTVYDETIYEYELPDEVTVIDTMSVKRNATDKPHPISAELYKVVNGRIYFSERANSFLTTGNILVIDGKYKLTDSDDIPEENTILHDYVINLAALSILKQVGMTKVLSFLHNDTSMAELINFRREVERDVSRLRSQLATSYMDA
jgi:hypothetical protein